MNDRFRFRVWDIKRRAMLYDTYYENMYLNIDEGYLYKEDGPSNMPYTTSIDDDYILMQCTGLKDKNGKLIYEGDILRREENGWCARVWWDNDSIGFRAGLPSMPGWFISPDYFRCNENIGNIYENPELLLIKRTI